MISGEFLNQLKQNYAQLPRNKKAGAIVGALVCSVVLGMLASGVARGTSASASNGMGTGLSCRSFAEAQADWDQTAKKVMAIYRALKVENLQPVRVGFIGLAEVSGAATFKGAMDKHDLDGACTAIQRTQQIVLGMLLDTKKFGPRTPVVSAALGGKP